MMVRIVFRHQDPSLTNDLHATFHNDFMFFLLMNRHGHHNIRNGIVWVQTGHSTCTFTDHMVFVIEL